MEEQWMEETINASSLSREGETSFTAYEDSYGSTAEGTYKDLLIGMVMGFLLGLITLFWVRAFLLFFSVLSSVFSSRVSCTHSCTIPHYREKPSMESSLASVATSPSVRTDTFPLHIVRFAHFPRCSRNHSH